MQRFVVVCSLTVLLLTGGCTDTTSPGAPHSVLVEPAPGNYLGFSEDGAPQVRLEEATVTLGICDEDVGDLKTGDQCLILSRRITNYDPEGWIATLWVEGFDESGAIVAGTQESALIPHQLGLDAPYQETVAFLMHLNAPQDVRTIRLYAQSHSSEHFQPGPSRIPITQEELTRITFSRDWLIENDMEPNPGTIRVTFPSSWLEALPIIPDGEATVALTVSTQLLMDSNTSKNPRS